MLPAPSVHKLWTGYKEGVTMIALQIITLVVFAFFAWGLVR